MNALIEFINRAGAQSLHFAGAMLLQSSLVILTLFALDAILRERVRAVVRHALWMLALVKLLLPVSLALPTSPAYWMHRQGPPPSPPILASPHADETTAVAGIPSDATIAPALRNPELRFEPPPAPTTRLEITGVALATAVIVALGLLGVVVRRGRVVRNMVHLSTAPTAGEARLEALLEVCSKAMGVRRRIVIRLSETVPGPVLCGLWRPVILIPTRLVAQLGETQLRAVLMHELAHVRRGDLWINYLQTLLQIAYWWHPLLWLANARIRRVREEAVDETVLVAMDREADSYPETLLDVARLAMRQPQFSHGLLGIMETKSTLGWRIRRMLSRPFPTTARIGFAGLAAVGVAAVVILPMARAEKKSGELVTAWTVTVELPSINGRTIQQWFDQYDFSSNITFSNQVVAMQAMRDLGTNAIPFLREKLRDPSTASRFPENLNDPRLKAVWILSNLGDMAEPALRDLIDALRDKEPLPFYAATALGNIGPKAAKEAIPALFNSLRFGNGCAARALAAIAPDHPDLVPTLITAFQSGKDSDLGQVRVYSAIALGMLGRRATPAVPALRAALQDQGIMHFAARALERIAPDLADVMAEVNAVRQQAMPKLPPIPELIARAKSGTSSERIQAIQNLGYAMGMAQFNGTPPPTEQVREEILPLLSEALDDEDREVVMTAANACPVLGLEARPLLDKLLALAENGNEVNGNIVGHLLQIAPADPRTLPLLLRCLDHAVPIIRGNAAAVLRAFGPEAREAVPGLQMLLKDHEPWVRFNAAIALWNIAQQAPAIPALVHHLNQDENGDFVPLALCKLFGEMGAVAMEAVPTLRDLLSHYNPKVREEARAALAQVNPGDPALRER